MKLSMLFTTLIVVSLTACDKNPADEAFVPAGKPTSSTQKSLNPLYDIQMPDATGATGELPPGHPVVNNTEPEAPSDDAPDVEMVERATVISTINIPQFTYIEVQQGDQVRWLAAAEIILEQGDKIKFDAGSTMFDFNSQVLERSFDRITFVNRVAIVTGK
ncbi:MAG: hypothetical protein R8M11_03655 [Gallionella sp.]